MLKCHAWPLSMHKNIDYTSYIIAICGENICGLSICNNCVGIAVRGDRSFKSVHSCTSKLFSDEVHEEKFSTESKIHGYYVYQSSFWTPVIDEVLQCEGEEGNS